MIPSIANIRKAIYCLNKRLDLLEGGEYSNTVTELSNKVHALESLINEDLLNPTSAIDKFNEIVAFLESILNTDNLSGLLQDIILLIPDEQILSDWNQINSNAKDFIKNKPTLFSGNYNDLSNKPTIPDNTGKADKVANATNGNLAGLDVNGNLTDSGIAINQITELDDTVVRTSSYDATVAVGLADNLRGDTVVDAEFYKRKTGGTQSVGSGIAAIKEVKGKSIVWNQLLQNYKNTTIDVRGVSFAFDANGKCTVSGTAASTGGRTTPLHINTFSLKQNHKYYITIPYTGSVFFTDITSSAYVAEWALSRKAIKTSSTSNDNVYLGLNTTQGRTYEGEGYFQLIDLTIMFGAGNEPATVEEFEKMFPLDYYGYKAGEIIPFAGQNLVTTGFNQFNGEYENGAINTTTGENIATANVKRCVGFIPVLSNTSYYCQRVSGTTGAVWMGFYDANKNIISEGLPNVQTSGNVRNVKDEIFTMPSNCAFIKFYVKLDSDVLFNISNPDRNGTYEPYEKHTLPLDPSQWRDTNNNLVFPYGGMHGVGTAYDYAKVDADGYIRKVVRVLGKYVVSSSDTFTVSNITYGSANLVMATGVSAKTNCVFVSKDYTTSTAVAVLEQGDKTLRGLESGNICFKDTTKITSSMTASQVAATLAGTEFIYELAEPVEVELATPVYAKYLVDKDGTEEITPANGTTPYTTMANLSVLYAMDARGEIKNLPKNYLSKESAENMLNAMLSAGVIASYTMTYDAANSRYTFVITAPAKVQPDWNQTNNSAADYIKNKPANLVGSTSVRTIIVLTLAQYDALATKDANTEYNIIESV